MNNYLFIGQLRLTEGGSNRLSMNIKAKTPATLESIVSRLGIDIKMEKPSMFCRPEGDQRKQPQRLSFPPVSSPMTRLPGEKLFVSIVRIVHHQWNYTSLLLFHFAHMSG